MTADQLIHIIGKGENSRVQFKENVTNAVSVSQEFVAFANSEGGLLIIGVNDKTGGITGLSFQDIQRINNLLSTAASDHVRSPIIIKTETVETEGKNAIVVSIPEGTDKPYTDKDGLIFLKNGSDKRKVTSREELARLLQSSGNLYAEEMLLPQADIGHFLDKDRFSEFFETRYHSLPDWDNLTRTIENLRLGRNGKLNVAGALLFGLDVRHLLPAFYISAVWFNGNEISGSAYLRSDNLFGTLKSQFQQGFEFIYAKLDKVQNGKDFNSIGTIEIPEVVIMELLINALIHRDYFIKDSIKLLVFDDRIEIRSPGKLPNNLTETEIRMGVSRRRNAVLSSFALDVLPYRALGSGILRALKAYPHIDFINDTKTEQFTVIIYRGKKG
jgi:ATP-dependent DNA helicase RecG